MDRILVGKNAVITGARRGIGRATVETFARNGANIWACARKYDHAFEADMAGLAEENGVWIKPVYFDLADRDEMKAAITAIMADKCPVDALINVAGITYNALFQMTTQEKLQELLDIDFRAPFFFTQYLLKLMLRNPRKMASVVSISSSTAIDANSGRGAYGASKAALICATRALAEELGGHGIRANCIAPGITDTDMVGESMSEAVIQKTISSTILKRIGKPNDVAETAAFLASDYSSYITGQVLRVDGGLGLG